MGGKPRKRKRTNAELEAAVKALGSNVLWALKFMQPRGGGGEGLVANVETGEQAVWTEKFMDSLDLIGYEIDREKFYASFDKNGRR